MPSSSIFSFEGTSSTREASDKVICMAGVDDGEVPPVPIPNTEVKLTCAKRSLRAEPMARPGVAYMHH